jgi:hypothetical protein
MGPAKVSGVEKISQTLKAHSHMQRFMASLLAVGTNGRVTSTAK